MNDLEHLQREIQAGDPQALASLFDLFADDLLRLAYVILANSHDAEDVVQDVLLSFVEKLRQNRFLDRSLSPRNYLKISVRNRCIDRLRKRGTFNFILLDEHERVEPVHSNIDLPTDHYEEKWLREKIAQAILQLPDAQRAVIVLRIVEEHSYEEIAEKLGISVNYVKNLLGRGRQRLRDILRPIIAE